MQNSIFHGHILYFPILQLIELNFNDGTGPEFLKFFLDEYGNNIPKIPL
jgi:hypothetical protein